MDCTSLSIQSPLLWSTWWNCQSTPQLIINHRTEHIYLFSHFIAHWTVVIDLRGWPLSRPVVITIFTQSVRQSVSPSVPNLQNQATITAGLDCYLTEWIIDYSCLVYLIFTLFLDLLSFSNWFDENYMAFRIEIEIIVQMRFLYVTGLHILFPSQFLNLNL